MNIFIAVFFKILLLNGKTLNFYLISWAIRRATLILNFAYFLQQISLISLASFCSFLSLKIYINNNIIYFLLNIKIWGENVKTEPCAINNEFLYRYVLDVRQSGERERETIWASVSAVRERERSGSWFPALPESELFRQ